MERACPADGPLKIHVCQHNPKGNLAVADNSRTKLTVLDQITSSDKVRKKIIDSASTLYARKGFRATSIEEVSEMAGVSLPVTYHYVKKKSEIMRMIMEDFLNGFRASLADKIRDIHDPKEKVAVAVSLYIKAVDKQKKQVLLIYQKSSSLDKTSKSRIMQLEVELSQILGAIIEEGVQKGLFARVDTNLMAYNIIMIAHMWVLKGWHFKRCLTLDQYIDLQLSTILQALRP